MNVGPIERSLCRYVGDAAGRSKDGTFPKDFSDTDIKLALNLGIEFSTPESFFLQSKSALHCRPPVPPTGITMYSHHNYYHHYYHYYYPYHHCYHYYCTSTTNTYYYYHYCYYHYYCYCYYCHQYYHYY